MRRIVLLALDAGDHVVEVDEDLLIYLDDAGLPVVLTASSRVGPAAVLAKFGQELRAGEKDRAGQTVMMELARGGRGSCTPTDVLLDCL